MIGHHHGLAPPTLGSTRAHSEGDDRRLSAIFRLVAAWNPDDRTEVTLPVAAYDDQSQPGPKLPLACA